MKWKLNSPEPAMLMYHFAKLLGLAPFKFRNKTFHLPGRMGQLYPVVIATIISVLMIRNLWEVIEEAEKSNLNLTVNWQALLSVVAVNCISASVTLITFSLMNEKAVAFMNELYTVTEELKNLGIKVANDEMIRHVFATTLKTNLVIVLMVIGFNFILPDRMMSATSIFYFVRDLINLSTIVIFCRILLYISECFALVNKKFYDTFEPGNQDGPAVFLVSEEARRENQEECNSLTDLQCVWKIESLHSKLCELLDQTICLFAVPIIFNSFRMLCDLVSTSYWLYSNFVSTSLLIWACTLRMSTTICEILLMTHAAETICRTGNATKIVLLRMWNKIKSAEVDDEFFMFSLQLLHSPVTVSAFGFLDLGYSFIYKILCAVVTYFVIMVQLDTSSRPVSAASTAIPKNHFNESECL